jgi:hypothetical protein
VRDSIIFKFKILDLGFVPKTYFKATVAFYDPLAYCYYKPIKMKNLIPAFFVLFIAVSVCSCNKNNDPQSYSIVGNWNLVSDSTWSSGIGPNGTPSSNTYKGVASDYFKFTNSGKLYLKEGSVKLDTADYTVSKDTLKLKYDYFYEGGVTINGAVGSYIVTTPNNHELELTDDFITPGGAIYERITLSK